MVKATNKSKKNYAMRMLASHSFKKSSLNSHLTGNIHSRFSAKKNFRRELTQHVKRYKKFFDLSLDIYNGHHN